MKNCKFYCTDKIILKGIYKNLKLGMYAFFYFWPHGHKTFRTPTPKSSNQNAIFIGYDILIGCFFIEYKYKTHTGKFYDHEINANL
jgi:hypothetical protein